MHKHKKTLDNVEIINKSNFEWKKIIRLIVIASFSALITFLAVMFVPKAIKQILRHKIMKNKYIPVRQITFSTSNNLSYFDPIYLINDLNYESQSYILVDTRSPEEFKTGHIKSALNAPLYKDFKSIEQSKTKLSEFRNNILNLNKKNKTVILYGYFSKSQILIDGANYLLNYRIKTQLLSISWYEFKNSPFSWMPGNDMGNTEINKFLEGSIYENK
jgi:hypothetical protein